MRANIEKQALSFYEAIRNSHRGVALIRELRAHFNREYTDEKYAALLQLLDDRSEAKVEFRISETPVFVPATLLQQMAR